MREVLSFDAKTGRKERLKMKVEEVAALTQAQLQALVEEQRTKEKTDREKEAIEKIKDVKSLDDVQKILADLFL